MLVAALAGLAQRDGGGSGSPDFAALTTPCLPGIACDQDRDTAAADVPISAAVPGSPPAQPPAAPAPGQEQQPLVDLPSIIQSLPLPGILIPGVPQPAPATETTSDPPSSPPAPAPAQGDPEVSFTSRLLTSTITIRNAGTGPIASWSVVFTLDTLLSLEANPDVTSGGGNSYIWSGTNLAAGASKSVNLVAVSATLESCTVNGQPC